MKKILKIISFAIAVVFLVSACDKVVQQKNNEKVPETVADVMDLEANIKGHKMAVVYFSCTGKTEKVATTIAETFDIDLIKIEPVVPYDDDALMVGNKNSRAYRECMYNPFVVEIEEEEMGETSPNAILPETEAREEIDYIKELPEIEKINVDAYDTIFLGYPIWYGDAPKVIWTFLKGLKNKTIIPFCTSDNDSIAASEEILMTWSDESMRFITGRRFEEDVTTDVIKDWITKMSADLYVR